MSDQRKQFIGGLLIIVASLWMIADSKGFTLGGLLPVRTTDAAWFIVLSENDTANPDVGMIEVMNSDVWAELPSQGIQALVYDTTPDDRKPDVLDVYIKELDGLATPAILVLDKNRSNSKMFAVPFPKTVAELEALKKRVTGK